MLLLRLNYACLIEAYLAIRWLRATNRTLLAAKDMGLVYTCWLHRLKRKSLGPAQKMPDHKRKTQLPCYQLPIISVVMMVTMMRWSRSGISLAISVSLAIRPI